MGVVFRRGPSGHAATFLWNRQTDTFTLGQWLKGRIYPKRSDLSPDGRHLIYLAADYQGSRDAGPSWTAVSRAPYLKALDLYANHDAWQGGGLFVDDQTYWLNNSLLEDDDIHSRQSDLTCDLKAAPQSKFGAEDPGVYYPRLLRDGWKWARLDGTVSGPVHVFRKDLPNGWSLEKWSHHGADEVSQKEAYWEEHALCSPDLDAPLHLPDWEWADRDGADVVWAANGQLFRERPSDVTAGKQVRALFDFAPMAFEAVTAPY